MAEIVLITGCGTGIGRALAENLATRKTKDGRRKFKVWATDYRLDAVAELEALGMGVAQLDVTSVESINAAVDLVTSTDGRIDMLVCNAGLTAPGYLTEMDYIDIERIFNVNLHGVFRTVQPVAKSMMARRAGKIAILSSVNAYFVQPFNAPYSGTKSAVAIMAESLRLELAPFGISVTSVCPAWVRSEIINNAPEKYERYERPESFFQTTIEVIRKSRTYGVSGGCTTQQAANDIANGLSKPRVPRYLYTGTSLLYSLFWGCVQQWLQFQPLAESLIARFKLPESAMEAPRSWAGPYIKPPKEEAPPTEDIQPPTENGEAPVANGVHNPEMGDLITENGVHGSVAPAGDVVLPGKGNLVPALFQKEE